MFYGCAEFNKPLDKWKVSEVTNMSGMFDGCANFNQPLNRWGGYVAKVTDMSYMFNECESFNRPLDQWIVSEVTDMSFMFCDCSEFNQSLNGWGRNVSKVWDMSSMFSHCIEFNQPLDQWVVSAAILMISMFRNCTAFNQPLLSWAPHVSRVRNLSHMFHGCHHLELELDEWVLHPNANTERINRLAPNVHITRVARRRTNPLEIHDFMKTVQFQALFQEIGPNQGFYSFTGDALPRLSYPFGTNQPIHTIARSGLLGRAISEFIKSTLQEIISQASEPQTLQLQYDLVIRSHKLNSIDIYHEYIDAHSNAPLRDMIFTALLFVKEQPLEYQIKYVSEFLEHATTAYPEYPENDPNRVSCPKGLAERLLFCLPAGSREMNDPDRKYARITLAVYGGCNALGRSTRQEGDEIVIDLGTLGAVISETLPILLDQVETIAILRQEMTIVSDKNATKPFVHEMNYPAFFGLIKTGLIRKELICVNDPLPTSVFTLLREPPSIFRMVMNNEDRAPNASFVAYADAILGELSDIVTTTGGGKRKSHRNTRRRQTKRKNIRRNQSRRCR
jgi:surface protein